MIYFLTLALDAMPWITHHLPVLNRLRVPWEWHVVQGVAEPVADTGWCRHMEPRLSEDGTHAYLTELAFYHPRVFHYHAPSWPGKTAMLQHATEKFTKPGLLWQLDSDEIWTAEQIEKVIELFCKNPDRDAAYFKCDYWLGMSIKTISRNTYGDNSYEWLRVFKFTPGMKWKCHEPPVLETRNIHPFTKQETEALGLVFQHYAYATEKQVVLKEEFYGYPNALGQWRRLQANKVWPVYAREFLKWITDDTIVDRLVNNYDKTRTPQPAEAE